MRFFALVALFLALVFVMRGCKDEEHVNDAGIDVVEAVDSQQEERDLEEHADAPPISVDLPGAGGPEALTEPTQSGDEEPQDVPPKEVGGATAGGNDPPGPEVVSRFATPSEARRFAIRQRERAKKHAKRGEVSTAFSETLEAWQALQPHLTSEEVRVLSERMISDLRAYDLKLNPTGTTIRGKPMQIK